MFFIFFFKQKTAYEMRISDWSSDVCSSDLADIERLAAGVADRVVVPGREPELMRILRPRVAGVRFAGHAAEPGIGQHVRPWRRRRLSLRRVDHVLVAVRGERAEAVAFAQRRGGWIERPRIGARAVADVLLP